MDVQLSHSEFIGKGFRKSFGYFNILKVIKYFRNKHVVPSGLYRQSRGKKLVMPLEIRWSKMNSNALKSFLENRGVLIQLCQDHKDVIESVTIKIVNDAQIELNSNDLIARLDPIPIALDRVQRDHTTISICVEVWHKLETDLSGKSLLVKKNVSLEEKIWYLDQCIYWQKLWVIDFWDNI
ncbi:hypothetical protein QE152_g23347 [Popillia japonica]|uniref:Uncharacterized protein n=1 Tax=Popillia japonica TaxID=7064 RepID=A0AAW1KHL2_POPJA